MGTSYENGGTNAGFGLLCDQLSTEEYPYDDAGARLIDQERQTPLRVTIDQSLRPKILDACGMACVFCHNEGTPVAQAHLGVVMLPNPRYRQGRVSVFEDTNGVDFLPGEMKPDEQFRSALGQMATLVDCAELHMTGGEPSLHRQLPELVRTATDAGYEVKMTSNGENVSASIEACALAGLRKVNFSIFGTNAEELAAVQAERYRTPHLAAAKIRALQRSIEACLRYGVKADANIVIAGQKDIPRVQSIIETYDARLSIRLLNDLEAGREACFAIYSLLASLKAEPVETTIEAGSSNSRVEYVLPDGRSMFFKQIRRTVLPVTCQSCQFNNGTDCEEGYYGVRLYVDQYNQYKVGVCLQRMDLTVNIEDFAASGLPEEIKQLRSDEYTHMIKYFDKRITVAGETVRG